MKNKKPGILIPSFSATTLGMLFPLSGNNPSQQKAKDKRMPNIIYILADDLGYSQLRCYGQGKIETPHIDALAARQMIFSQHYAGAPLCALSRCVLLTGKHVGHAQIRANDDREGRGEVWNYAKVQENPEVEGQYLLKAGSRTDLMSAFYDVIPTLCDVVGMETKENEYFKMKALGD